MVLDYKQPDWVDQGSCFCDLESSPVLAFQWLHAVKNYGGQYRCASARRPQVADPHGAISTGIAEQARAILIGRRWMNLIIDSAP